MTHTEFLEKCDELLPTLSYAHESGHDFVLWKFDGGWQCGPPGVVTRDFAVDGHIAIALREKQAREWLAERSMAIVPFYKAGKMAAWAVSESWQNMTMPICNNIFDDYHSALVAALEAAKEADHE